MSREEPSFGGVKIFNERSTNATVMVQLCTTRGGPPVASSGMKPVPPGNSANPVPWTPPGIVNFVKSVMVDVYDADGTTHRVTFGPMGVGFSNGAILKNVRITLSGSEGGNVVGTVLVELCDATWTKLRSAQQHCMTGGASSPNVTFECTTQKLSGVNIVLGTWNTSNQSGIVQSQPNQNPPFTTWTLMQVSASPMAYQILTTATGPTGPAAIGVWLNGNGPAKVAGQYNPANSSSSAPITQMILVQYAEGTAPIGEGNYQIVDLADGYAMTSVNADFQTQFGFVPPDSPNPPNQQYFNVLGID